MRNRANSIAHGGGLCLLRPTELICLPYKSARLDTVGEFRLGRYWRHQSHKGSLASLG